MTDLPIGLLTLGFSVFTAIFYLFGLGFNYGYLLTMGLHPYQFPTEFREVILDGFLVSTLIVLAGALVVIIAGGLFGFVSTFVKPKLDKRSAWIKISTFVKRQLDKLSAWIAKLGKMAYVTAWAGLLLTLVFGMCFCIELLGSMWANIEKQEILFGESWYPKLALTLKSGETFCPSGVRIICSERFCGFNDGKHATVVSLDGVNGVRSMRTELPAECPTTPPGALGRTELRP